MGAYITILHDGKKRRLRALPHQEYNTEKNIQGDKSIREMYKQGTILYTSGLEDTGRGFYRASGVRLATRKEAKCYEGLKLKIEKGEEQKLFISDEINIFEAL